MSLAASWFYPIESLPFLIENSHVSPAELAPQAMAPVQAKLQARRCSDWLRQA